MSRKTHAMSIYKPIPEPKQPEHFFNGVGVYLNYGHVKTYTNRTQGEAKVRELNGLGYDCFLSAKWPFTIHLNKAQQDIKLKYVKTDYDNEFIQFEYNGITYTRLLKNVSDSDHKMTGDFEFLNKNFRLSKTLSFESGIGTTLTITINEIK